MEIFNQLNEVLNYIEDNLLEDISTEKLAQIAMLSSYNFQRLFSYLVGVSLAEYIRGRRLVKAGFDLQKGGKVIDVAFRYGYESSTSFSRAFKAFHGMSPSTAGQPSSILKEFPRVNFDITIEGVMQMYQRVIKDWLFTSEQTTCNFRSAGILIHKDKVFLQREKEGHEYAIPGGTVRIGETAEESVVRAYLSETGIEIKVDRLAWVEEIFWEWNQKETQTLCFHFLISVKNEGDLEKFPSYQKKNDQIIFEWKSLDELSDMTVYPDFAKDKFKNLADHIEHFVSDQRR